MGRIISHIIFWIVVFAITTIIFGRISGSYVITAFHLILISPLYFFATYFALYYILPKTVYTGKYHKTFVFSVYLIFAVIILEMIMTMILVVIPIPTQLSIDTIDGAYNIIALDTYLRVGAILAVVFLAVVIKLTKNTIAEQKRTQQLEAQKLRAELDMLKSQIHPHFLFNTLNSLYALVLQKSDEAPEVVLQLSGILNYILYECNEKYVPLEKEITLLKDYVELQKLRYGKRVDVLFEIDDGVIRKKIIPLLIFPLLENCFKHGVGKSNSKTEIAITMKQIQGTLLIKICNTLHTNVNEDSQNKSGIGLANIRKRLELHYPKQHTFQIDQKNNTYCVELSIAV